MWTQFGLQDVKKHSERGGRRQTWERREINATRMLVKNISRASYAVSDKNTGEKWVVESGARPAGDASANLLL